MPGGKGQIKGTDGTPFSSTNQPANRGRKPDTISGWLKQELQSDGFAVMDAELLDADDKPTGQKVRVRAKLVTMQAVAKRLLANAAAGREKSIEMLLDRTEGKVPQRNENDTTLNIGEQTAKTILKIGFRPPEDAKPTASPLPAKPKAGRKSG